MEELQKIVASQQLEISSLRKTLVELSNRFDAHLEECAAGENGIADTKLREPPPRVGNSSNSSQHQKPPPPPKRRDRSQSKSVIVGGSTHGRSVSAVQLPLTDSPSLPRQTSYTPGPATDQDDDDDFIIDDVPSLGGEPSFTMQSTSSSNQRRHSAFSSGQKPPPPPPRKATPEPSTDVNTATPAPAPAKRPHVLMAKRNSVSALRSKLALKLAGGPPKARSGQSNKPGITRRASTSSGDHSGLSTNLNQSYNFEDDPMDTQKKHESRGKIREEILATERSYLLSLKTLIEEYIDVLESKCKSFSLDPATIQAMFSNVRVIHGFHTVFLADLEQAGSTLPEVFVKNADFLRMYTQYLNDYTGAMNAINSLRNNRRFQDFLAVQRSKHTMGLMSYLIMPVQRIPRYVLLLQELLKHTTENHPTRKSLDNALEKVKDIAMHVNEQKRKVENMSKLLEIQNKITGADFTLLLPNRVMVKEGTLKKVSVSFTKSMSMSPVSAFLFNDVFLWTNTSNKLKGFFPLEKTSIDGADDVEGGMCMFSLKCEKKTLTLYTTSFEEQKEWVGKIKTAVEEKKADVKKTQTRKWQARTQRSAKLLAGRGKSTLGKEQAEFLRNLAKKNSNTDNRVNVPASPDAPVKAHAPHRRTQTSALPLPSANVNGDTTKPRSNSANQQPVKSRVNLSELTSFKFKKKILKTPESSTADSSTPTSTVEITPPEDVAVVAETSSNGPPTVPVSLVKKPAPPPPRRIAPPSSTTTSSSSSSSNSSTAGPPPPPPR